MSAGGERKPGIGKLVGKAATSTSSLAVMGAAGVAAAALTSWPVLAVGGVAYAAMVAWDLASPDFRKKALSGRQPGEKQPIELPDPDDVMDPLARRPLVQIVRARAALRKVLAETSDDVTSRLGTAISSIEELVKRAATLIARTDDLGASLAGRDPDALRREIGEIEARRARTRDVDAGRELDAALAARRAENQALDEIAAARDQALAHLARIAATMAGLSPKIVELRALDAQAMDDLAGSLAGDLDKLDADLESFEAPFPGPARSGILRPK